MLRVRMRRRWTACWLLLCAGCGGSAWELRPVKGTVTLDGQPLAQARVVFEPQRQGESPLAGPASTGMTDAEGHFELTTFRGERGAVVGPHRITISTYQGSPIETEPPLALERVPSCYFEEGALRFDVPADGESFARFELTSP